MVAATEGQKRQTKRKVEGEVRRQGGKEADLVRERPNDLMLQLEENEWLYKPARGSRLRNCRQVVRERERERPEQNL